MRARLKTWGICRRLLQRQGIPLMFSADQLWDQGFRGAGVKMGVFDTGIRSDHPHVKNIRCVGPLLHGPVVPLQVSRNEEGKEGYQEVAGLLKRWDKTSVIDPGIHLHCWLVKIIRCASCTALTCRGSLC